MRNGIWRAGLASSVAASLATAAGSPDGGTLTLTPIDTSLVEASPDANLGGSWLAVGADSWGARSRALVRFETATLFPADAVVTNVRLVLAVTQVPEPSSGVLVFELHRLMTSWRPGCLGYPVADDWGDDSSLCGDNRCPECATWLHSGVENWFAPGAAPFFDYDPNPSGSARLAGSALIFENQVAMRQDVQSWVTDGFNRGWILMAADETQKDSLRRFGSAEHSLLAPRLTVTYSQPPPTPPTILSGPFNARAPTGGRVTFSVVTTGSAPLQFQWYQGGIAISQANAEQLVLRDLTKDRSGAYFVRVSNAGGSVNSPTATLEVLDPPVIVTEPVGRLVHVGSPVSLWVGAVGDQISYQWHRNGNPIPGATETGFALAAFQAQDEGRYVVHVTSPVGVAYSRTATLTAVRAPVVERLRFESGEVRFEFQVQAGVACTVQYADTVPTSGWRTLIRVSSPVTPMLFPVADRPPSRERYYRVVAD